MDLCWAVWRRSVRTVASSIGGALFDAIFGSVVRFVLVLADAVGTRFPQAAVRAYALSMVTSARKRGRRRFKMLRIRRSARGLQPSIPLAV
jgi:hypothetical protein